MSVVKKHRVVLIGVGGATCSGKTTLAKYLRYILPNSFIIHQDDFAPPQELIPVHPVYDVQDWDSPQGSIDWGRMVSFLAQVREAGVIPIDHRSHDHLNEQKEVPVAREVLDRWKKFFVDVQQEWNREREDEEIVWGLVDGFLLYWNMDIVAQLDVRIFLRVPHDVLKQRRFERHGYHTAVQSDPEGALWRDPPDYWEQIVWPAYMEAHREVFVDGDVEHGKSSEKVEGLVVVDALDITMGEMIDCVCEKLKKGVVQSIVSET